ncbi:MAG: hypothetical protein IPK01_17785 [Acidobacteria bacterium]|nr:hypothetical protein [Acidobacteriota bacterium]
MSETSLKKERAVPKWETDTRDRMRVVIKKYAKPLADLCGDANEGDTRLIVTDFLCEGLGYDKYAELTTEYRVKGEFADFGIRLDQKMFAFIECEESEHDSWRETSTTSTVVCETKGEW